MSDETKVRVTSAYGNKTRKPLVNLMIGEHLFTWDADEAKRVSDLLGEAAMASDADAFLFEWAAQALESEQAAAALLIEFRKWREKREHHNGESP